MGTSFFHLLGRDCEDVAVDPRPAKFRDFARTQHRQERKEKKLLDAVGEVFDDRHRFWELLPPDGRHWAHLWRSKDAAQPLNGIVLDKAGTDGEVEHLTRSHEDALKCRPLPFGIEVADGVNYQWSRDLVDLPAANLGDHVHLHAPFFVPVGDDPAALQAFPEPPCVLKNVSALRDEPGFLTPSTRLLAGGFESHLWPAADGAVGDATTFRESKDPDLFSGWHHAQREAVAIRNGVTLFRGLEARDFF